MKTCKTCKIEKPIDEFYRHSEMLDGHLNICKSCTRSRIAKHRESNLEKIRAYDRQRGRTEERKALNRERSRTGKYFHIAKEWIKRNPLKRRAHILLWNALRNGRIEKKPCEVCNEQRSEAHHDDYTKPLDVRWLCKKHHSELHRKYKD